MRSEWIYTFNILEIGQKKCTELNYLNNNNTHLIIKTWRILLEFSKNNSKDKNCSIWTKYGWTDWMKEKEVNFRELFSFIRFFNGIEPIVQA